MTIANFPAALQPAIQDGFLEREFKTGLESTTVYRSIASLEIFPSNVGETITKTRKGLKAPVTTPLNPSSNTGLDNGLTPATWTIEQYDLTVNMYGDTIDLNMVTTRVGIQGQFLHNAYTNGVQAGQSIDRVARNALNAAYMSGHTMVTATLGTAGPTIAVDDIRGFMMAPKNGKMEAVSGSNTLSVLVDNTVYTLTGYAADGSNTSSLASIGGISGTLTFSGNVTTTNGTAGKQVKSLLAPTIIRVGGRTTTAGLLATDLFGMSPVLDAVTQLRNNAVPTINGKYNCYLDNTSARQLFADDDFKQLYRGKGAVDEFTNARVLELLDVRFLPTTEAIQQTVGAVGIHRPIVVGQGALVEGVFDDTAYNDLAGQAKSNNGAQIDLVAGIAQITRPPLDRLQQVVAQSWYYIGGFVAPTDVTATQQIIPTSNGSLFKRAVMIEHGK